MSKRFIFTLVLMTLALFGLSACTPCDMVSPGLVSPDWREILDPNVAVLNWNYVDSCTPDNFEIILSKDNSFSVIEHTGTVAGSTTTWTAPTLDDAEEYFWRVRAVDEGTNGPWSTELRSFFTGPVCSAGDLVAPNLVYPDFGGIYDNDYESLEWSWPLSTCIPESYLVEVSPGSPAFTDTTYNGATGTPGTRWGFGSTPPMATQFWWRITALSDGAAGPPSLVRMFWTAPVCSGASLIAPTAETPDHGDIVTMVNPIFTWSYPSASCAPEGYHLWISDTPDMSSVVFDAYNPNLAAREMQAAVTLNDCTTYYWQVAMISEGIEGPPSSIPKAFAVDLTDSCACGSSPLPIPNLVSPGPYEIIPDTLPFLQWTLSGSCLPEAVNIDLNRFHDFSGPSLGGTAILPSISWSPSPPLEPATQYWWRAYSLDDSNVSDLSSQRSFFTGPECTSPDEVVAPVRIAPADGSTVNTLTPSLKYTPGVPGCIPDGYLLHLHEMADFSDLNLLTEYTLPATTVMTDPLTNCQEYHWSVTAVQDGAYGPESDHGSFVVDVDGTCTLPGIPATAKGNFFCKAGTYDMFEDLWTVEIGHRLLAIGRNPQTTYLLFTMLDQDTKELFKPEIQCWGWIGKVDLGWPELEDDGQHDFEFLEVFIPPIPPAVETCRVDMGAEECKKAGGSYEQVKRTGAWECICP
jgi:hypothetical protein